MTGVVDENEVGAPSGAQDGDAVTTAEPDSLTATDDLEARIEEAEAEAKKAEAVAAAARARVREMRSGQPGAEAETLRPWDKLRRRLRRPTWSAVAKTLAVIVIVGTLAGSGYILWRHHQMSVERQRADEFAAEAQRGAVALFSLDFNHAKQDVQRIIDSSTGAFRDDYTARADDFVKVVETSKVVTQASVRAAAVEPQSMTDDSAVVLVAVEQQVTNAAGAKQDPRYYRLSVTVARDGDQLKLSRVELVP